MKQVRYAANSWQASHLGPRDLRWSRGERRRPTRGWPHFQGEAAQEPHKIPAGRKPGVIPLVAASTTDQMRENLDALDITLGADDMARLNSATA